MAEDNRIPDHLADGPTIDDADFVLGGFSTEEVTGVHVAVTNLSSELREMGPDEPIRYFVLGNYDDGRKQWLEQARDLLEYYVEEGVAFLLSDLDAENDDWENFYIKFRYTLSLVDYPVLVAEDNDGGHELELGEVSLSDTYVVKRDYEPLSIRHDLEYEKYDAMMGKLFDVMDRRGHLFEWTDAQSFARGVRRVGAETRSEGDGRNDESDRMPTAGPTDALPEYDDRDVPAGWKSEENAAEPTGESVTSTTLVKYTYDDDRVDMELVLRTRGRSDSYGIELEASLKSEGRHRAVPIISGPDYEKLRRLTKHFVYVFQHRYEREESAETAIDEAKKRVQECYE